MTASRLPYERLVSVDARMAQAAAKPVIVPDTIVCDRHRVFLSEAFVRACQTLGISVQPAHPRTPTDKRRDRADLRVGQHAVFCQHVAGYAGSDVTRRGAGVADTAVWSVPKLQALLDEWVVAGWQPRPHDGLRHPRMPSRPLTADDYIELLPACWRRINDYGIRLAHRTYDCAELGAYRRQPSGAAARKGRWEVHYDAARWIDGRVSRPRHVFLPFPAMRTDELLVSSLPTV